jgi:hypothetical protein
MWREFAEVWRPFITHTDTLEGLQKFLMEVMKDAV